MIKGPPFGGDCPGRDCIRSGLSGGLSGGNCGEGEVHTRQVSGVKLGASPGNRAKGLRIPGLHSGNVLRVEMDVVPGDRRRERGLFQNLYANLVGSAQVQLRGPVHGFYRQACGLPFGKPVFHASDLEPKVVHDRTCRTGRGFRLS